MKHYLDLIPISARLHRRQSRMTRICIVLAVFLVSVMFGLADMYLQGAAQKEMQEGGSWHYKITSVDSGTAELIAARPEVTVSGWQGTLPAETGYTLNGQPVALSGQSEQVFQDIYLGRLLEGNYPEAADELALPEALAKSLSLSIGDTAILSEPGGESLRFTVTGLLEDSGSSRLSSGTGSGTAHTAVLSEDGFSLLPPADGAWSFVIQFSRFCAIPDIIADIQQQYQLADGQLHAHTSLLSIEGQLRGNSVSQIYQVAFFLSILVMLACILMISSSLNSSVSQRTEFFGLLRCLGASRKQILRFVRREALYWCRSSMPAGILLSVLVVWILSAAMRAVSPQWFAYMPKFGVSWPGIASGILLGLITVLLAARSPAKLASKASPLEAVSGNAYQAASFRRGADTRFFRIETALGIHHARARKKSYLLMTGAFAVCICLFLAFSTLVDFMENAMMPKAWTPELSIVSEDNTCALSPLLLEEASQSDSVKRAYGRMFAYDVPAVIGGTLRSSNLISYEENQFRWAEASLTEGSVDAAANELYQVLVVSGTESGGVTSGSVTSCGATPSGIMPGDIITLSIGGKEHAVTVAGILSDSPLAREEGTETIICSEATFTALTGETGYTIIDVQFQNSASDEDAASVKALFSDGAVFTDSLSRVRQQRNLYHAFALLVYGFLTIITAITVFHIMNAIRMGVSSRMRQYGMMRAAGMSSRQLTKMLLSEALTYAASGIFLGCFLGIPVHWAVYVSLITNFWGLPWSVPYPALGFITGVILLTALLAVREPAKRIRSMPIVKTISIQ